MTVECDTKICFQVFYGLEGGNPLGEAEKLAEWYIDLNEKIAKKLKAEPYKPLDRDGLTDFLGRFIKESGKLPLGEQSARLLSGLAFGQFLPNANHRTAVTLATLWLGLNGIDLSTEERFEAKASEYVQRSKEDIERAYGKAGQFRGARRFNYLWVKYWPGHLRLTRKFLESILPVKEAAQSGRWGKTPSIHLESLLIISSLDS